MASSMYDDSSSDSNLSQVEESFSFSENEYTEITKENEGCAQEENKFNLVHKLANRQLYGRFTWHPKSKTERVFNNVHCQCRYRIEKMIVTADQLSHVFMGFTLCSRFFISYKEMVIEDFPNRLPEIEYELYIWRFVPGMPFKFVSKHRIFQLLKGPEALDEIMFLQFPTDPYKIICYGLGVSNPSIAFITVLTLPIEDNCKYCNTHQYVGTEIKQGWCINHGFMLHFMFPMAQPAPIFEPHMSLSYPDHLVINTGHYIHTLNIASYEPISNTPQTNLKKEEERLTQQNVDAFSEAFDLSSDNFSTNSVVEAILEDFSDYDLEGNDCNKPFHELNISCEPLNVTGRSYHNALVQNIADPRLKRLQNTKDCLFSMPQCSNGQKQNEKSKLDKKVAEKAYEFTEETEKCEKLSSFRKRRLADKKYEFSEDNTENIVPYRMLRSERRYLYRGWSIQSPEYMFLSPRSSRSPMQSPSSRNGQFSPSSMRHLYCPLSRNSPHHSKSPISPKDTMRKINVYSPSCESDISDCESKLVLRPIGNVPACSTDKLQNVGLLIVDSRRDEQPKWIKKLVRRYSSADFETSSLLSGQSRDDYNIPIEVPLIVQTLMDQHLDIVPESRVDQISETQLIITQRTFDCEQFVQRRAQSLCVESHLEFLHCEDYDIKLLHICPLNGHIICQAVIKVGALDLNEMHYSKPKTFIANCLFAWSLCSDSFEIIELPDNQELKLPAEKVPNFNIPEYNRKEVLVMDFNCHASKTSLRDYNNYFEICTRKNDFE